MAGPLWTKKTSPLKRMPSVRLVLVLYRLLHVLHAEIRQAGLVLNTCRFLLPRR